MPKIKTARSLVRKIPEVSGVISTKGAGANIGKGLADVAEAAYSYGQRQNNNQLAKANSDMSTFIIGESAAYDEDPDYKTIENRFTGNTTKKMGEIAANITDAATREKFLNSFKPKVAMATEKVNDIAWGKERSFERGGLSTRLTTQRDAAILSGDIGGAGTMAGDLIQSHVDLGHISAEEAAKMNKSFKDSLTKGYIKAQPPEKRLEALKNPTVKKNLPPDVFAELNRAAESELREGKAQTQVDEYMTDPDVDRIEVMDKIEKKYGKDPALRKEVEARFDYDFNKREKGIAEGRDKLHSDYFLPVRAGEMMVKDIPREELERMSPKQQNSLFAAQANSVAKSKTPYNVIHDDTMNALYRSKNFQDLRQYFRDNAHELSDAQLKQWSKTSVEGVVPEHKAPFTLTETINNKVPGYSKEKRGELKESVSEWVFDYQEKEKQYPDDKAINNEIDRKIMEYGTTGWFMGRDPTPTFKMEEEEQKFVLKSAKEENKKAYNDAEEYFKGKGVQPDMGQFMQVFDKLKGRPNAE